MKDFQYFYFYLPGNMEIKAKESLPIGDKPYFEKTYKAWHDHFVQRASIFSSAQFAYHRDIVMREAIRTFGCQDEDDVREYYGPEYYGFAERAGLNQHHRDRVNYLQYLGDQLDPNRPLIISRREALQEYIDSLASDHPSPSFYFPMLDGFWFNEVMTPGLYGDDVPSLRRMPYQDYLETPHWRATRSAMLMLHRGRCQASHSFMEDSWWFGSESHLHVHHLTYANRGNERYEDLLLLCKGCHEKAHQYGIKAAMIASKWLMRKEAGILW